MSALHAKGSVQLHRRGLRRRTWCVPPPRSSSAPSFCPPIASDTRFAPLRFRFAHLLVSRSCARSSSREPLAHSYRQSFFFGPGATAEIKLEDVESRKLVDIVRDGQTEKLPLFYGNESIKGKVLLKIPAGKKIEHGGVKIELLGQIGT